MEKIIRGEQRGRRGKGGASGVQGTILAERPEMEKVGERRRPEGRELR